MGSKLCRSKFCNFIKDFDMFGKEARLFYNGEEKKTTWFGIILTILYFLLNIVLLSYKLSRMLKKDDVSFYEINSYKEKPPSIQLSQNNFYGGFGLEVPETYDPFINETIYIPKAYFKEGIRYGEKWIWTTKELELEKCNINKFGEFYKDKFNTNALNYLYCFKEMNETLYGHFSYDNYSFIFIQLYPCINTTENNNHCQSPDEIDKYLKGKGTFICMEFEDVELTPHNYSYPVRARNQDIYFTVGKKLFREVHIFYQIVEIETDLEIIGIDELEKLKVEPFLKYHSNYQMTNIIENNIYETGEPFCEITIKLYDQSLTQRRTYTKLITIWEDLGGIREIILSFFSLISSFFIDKSYSLSIVNTLFSFNIKKKIIIYKFLKENELSFSYISKINFNRNKTFIGDEKNEKLFKYANPNKKPSKLSSFNNVNGGKPKNNCFFKENLNKCKTSNLKIIKNYTIGNFVSITSRKKLFKKNTLKKTVKGIINKNENNNKNKIKEISIKNLLIYYLLLYCRGKRKNDILKKQMLEDGMQIFSQKMDIFNIFKFLVKNEIKLNGDKSIKMSNDLINLIDSIYKKDFVNNVDKGNDIATSNL